MSWQEQSSTANPRLFWSLPWPKEAATRLGRIGFDFAGYLEGGMEAVNSRPELHQQTFRVSATTLVEEQASPHPPLLIDVRTERERRRSELSRAFTYR
jgi:hypothetical protein